jgi:Uma2 family endonuclease
LRGNPCRPFNSDTKLRVAHDGATRFYYPDLQVVCESNDFRSVYQDRPILIIEVLSPATRRYDLDEKMTSYLAIPSLQSYIVLEQHQPIAILMRRTVNGFVRETIQGLNSQIDFPFLTSSLPMDEIYEGIEFTPECVQEAEETYSP